MMPATLIAGWYELGPAIGGGAAGIVYLGWDVRSGERVAIKALRSELLAWSPELLDGFSREVELLRGLHHPNIIRLLAAGVAGDRHYLVIEYAGGGSLADLLQRQPQLSVDRTLTIGLGVAAALSQVHATGILHRDVKPSNILLAGDGTPRLSDFGLARRSRPGSPGDLGLDGTFLYMSPEAWYSGKVDARVDIWSLGVVFFEMLAGRRPFDGDSPDEIRWAIQNAPLPDVRDFRAGLPAGLGGLVQRMLMRDVAARISSARLVCEELAHIQKCRQDHAAIIARPAFRNSLEHGYPGAQELV